MDKSLKDCVNSFLLSYLLVWLLAVGGQHLAVNEMRASCCPSFHQSRLGYNATCIGGYSSPQVAHHQYQVNT